MTYAENQANALDTAFRKALPEHDVFVEAYNYDLIIRYRVTSPGGVDYKQDGLRASSAIDIDVEVAVVVTWFAERA